MADRDENGKFINGNQASRGNGRPKGSFSINDTLRKLLDEQISKTFPEFAKDPTLKKKKGYEVLARKIIIDALKGDTITLKELWQQLEGKPAQNINHGGQEGNPIEINVNHVRPKDNE